MTDSLHNNDLLFTIPVVDVLSYYGKRVDHRGYMYYSPFREESEPSMRVTVNPTDGTWMWADYGGSPESGKKADGGGCLQLVKRLSGVSTDAAAFEELRRIAVSRGMTVIGNGTRPARRDAARPAGIVVDRVSGTFTRRSLLRYAEEVRGISPALLGRYCREVLYHAHSNASRQFSAIGFPNDAGGYALRGSGPKGGKRNTASGITTLLADGTPCAGKVPSGGKCALFEGFMDFLSYLEWKGVREPGIDVCVLNSTSMLGHARSWVMSHDKVRCFFDNDEAGNRATETVASWCAEKGMDFKDGRVAYGGHNDLNEAWTAELGRRKARLKGPEPDRTGIKMK